MNSRVGTLVIRFIGLVLVQVVLCNHINFLGAINPYIYIIFVLLFPIKDNRLALLFFSFLLGLLIDLFSDSGGVHAAAALCLAYARPIMLKTCFGMLYEHQTVKFNTIEISNLITYVAFAAVVHHFIMFYLEIFNSSSILLVLKKTLFSSIFTTILSVLIIILFSRNRK